MPPREKDDAMSIDKYDSHAVNFESPVANEKAWIFEDALKLIGECQFFEGRKHSKSNLIFSFLGFGYAQYYCMLLCGVILLGVINETMG